MPIALNQSDLPNVRLIEEIDASYFAELESSSATSFR